jgi:hypothetical protein
VPVDVSWYGVEGAGQLVGEDDRGEGACALSAPLALPPVHGLELGDCP